MLADATLSKPPDQAKEHPLELNGVLQSRVFEKSPALRRLLLYLWEHRAEEINEYAIATEALDRREDFDPRTDAAVRVQIARLRQKLKEFYDERGAADPWRVSIPLGSYNVHVEAASERDFAVPSWSKQPTKRLARLWPSLSKRRKLAIYRIAVLCAIGVSLGVGWFGGTKWQERRISRSEVSSSAVAPSFWRDFLKSGRQARIVLPTPVFFTWIDKADNTLVVRDPAVNSYRDLESSGTLSNMEKELGKPVLAQDYTVASDTRASFRLAQYLEPFGIRVAPSSTSDLPPESPDNENLILLGTIGTLSPYRGYLDRLRFHIPDHKQYIEDIQPVAGQPSRFETVRESPSRVIAPGILALLPGRSPGTFVLILAGYHTNALVSYLTSASGLEDLQKVRSLQGNPRFFEAVVLSEVNDVNPLRSWIVSFKPIAGS